MLIISDANDININKNIRNENSDSKCLRTLDEVETVHQPKGCDNNKTQYENLFPFKVTNVNNVLKYS